MSAFGGKADAFSCIPICPLMTQSGHHHAKGHLVQVKDFAWSLHWDESLQLPGLLMALEAIDLWRLRLSTRIAGGTIWLGKGTPFLSRVLQLRYSVPSVRAAIILLSGWS